MKIPLKLDLAAVKNAIKNIDLQDKKTLIGILAISAVLIYLDLFFVMGFQFNAIKSLTPKIERLQKDIVEFNESYKNMVDMKKNKTLDQQKLASQKSIISEPDFPLLLQDISDRANKSQVKVMQIKYAREEKIELTGRKTVKGSAKRKAPVSAKAKPKTQITGKSKAKPTGKNAKEKAKEAQEETIDLNEKFTAFSISLDISCNYHNLGVFLNSLEDAQAIIKLQDMKISSSSEDSLRQEVNLDLVAYVYKNKG